MTLTWTAAKDKPSDKKLPSGRALIEARACESSLGRFMRTGWRYAGQSDVFSSNWHIDCISDHLTAAVDWQLGQLIIFALPPRHMKSLGINVFTPAWTWAQEIPEDQRRRGLRIKEGSWRGAGTRFAFISFSDDLSMRDSIWCRTLVESGWYQERWGDRFKLVRANDHFLANSAGGNRRAMSFSGGLTGFGAHIICVDDAHNIQSKAYEVERLHVLDSWNNALNSRLDDAKHGIYIVAMQRSHERDLIGHILAKEFNGVYVCLPAEFERGHPYVFLDPRWPVERKTMLSEHGGPALGTTWQDVRTEGQVLWEDRFPVEVLRERQKGMLSHTKAGQYQQRPTAQEGGLFKRHWFNNPVPKAPANLVKVRSWDTAATEEGHSFDPDYTVGILMGLDAITNMLYVLDVIRGRWSPGDVEDIIKRTAVMDGTETRIYYPQAPGAAGKFEAYRMVAELQGYTVSTEREVGDKAFRADPLAGQAEHGFVKLVEAPWNESFIDEMCSFPNGAHDDQVDAAAGAFRTLLRRPQWGMIGV